MSKAPFFFEINMAIALLGTFLHPGWYTSLIFAIAALSFVICSMVPVIFPPKKEEAITKEEFNSMQNSTKEEITQMKSVIESIATQLKQTNTKLTGLKMDLGLK